MLGQCYLEIGWFSKYVRIIFFCKWAELILQALSHFTYITAHSDSPSFPSLHLRHSSFSNPSLTLPTSQVILQTFSCFTYVTGHSPTLISLLLRTGSSLNSPREPPMVLKLSLYVSTFHVCACHSALFRIEWIYRNLHSICDVQMFDRWGWNTYITYQFCLNIT